MPAERPDGGQRPLITPTPDRIAVHLQQCGRVTHFVYLLLWPVHRREDTRTDRRSSTLALHGVVVGHEEFVSH